MTLHLFEFIPLLRCPVSRQALSLMNEADLLILNKAIESGSVRNYEGTQVRESLEEGLISQDRSYVYPILEGFIPVLLMNKAIAFSQHDQGYVDASGRLVEDEYLSHQFSSGKKAVQQFYDDFGWKKEGESYKDTLTFEDRRPVADQYWRRCHLRLNKYLPGGEYLLDIASGSIPTQEGLSYCQKYKLRVCMDFSLLAMKEAALRLKGRGIFIVGDMTNLPLKENCMDGLISLHTVYHIPREEQTLAIEESLRVLRKEKQAVIIYSWKKSGLMTLAFKLWHPLLKTYKFLKNKEAKKGGKDPESTKEAAKKQAKYPYLFVQQQNYDWYSREIKKNFDAKLRVYSAISRSFSVTFIRDKAFGRQISSLCYWMEDTFPSLMGRWGQYPVFLLTKKEDMGPEMKIRPVKDHRSNNEMAPGQRPVSQAT